MLPLDPFVQFSVLRARQRIFTDQIIDTTGQGPDHWSRWSFLPFSRLEGVLERCDVEGRLDDVVGFLLENPQAITQADTVLEASDQVSRRFALEVGELVLGSDGDGEDQLELYIRLHGTIEELYACREEIISSLNNRHAREQQYLAPVVLRKNA